MKVVCLLIILTFSSLAMGRQMFQCALKDPQSTDVMVVNLQTPAKGTVFLSSGMQNSDEERIIVNIELDKIQDDQHIMKIVGPGKTGQISIPENLIGKASNSLEIDLSFAEFSFTFSCFSRLYE